MGRAHACSATSPTKEWHRGEASPHRSLRSRAWSHREARRIHRERPCSSLPRLAPLPVLSSAAPCTLRFPMHFSIPRRSRTQGRPTISTKARSNQPAQARGGRAHARRSQPPKEVGPRREASQFFLYSSPSQREAAARRNQGIAHAGRLGLQIADSAHREAQPTRGGCGAHPPPRSGAPSPREQRQRRQKHLISRETLLK